MEVSFEEAGAGTAVSIVHRGWEGVTEGVTERYREACATTA